MPHMFGNWHVQGQQFKNMYAVFLAAKAKTCFEHKCYEFRT